MKTKTIVISWLIFWLVVSCTPREIPKTDNFSFIFEEYSCGYLPLLNHLDTSTGILIHTPLGKSKPVEIPFVLSESEMETIYQKMVSTNYFHYPSEVRIPARDSSTTTFRLKVINGSFTNDVKWTDDFNVEPNFPKDDRLIELFNLIQNIIHSHLEYPQPNAACA